MRSGTTSSDNIVAAIFLVGCGAVSLWATSVGWSHTILDVHGFRQSQTAISAFWMLRGRPWLAYETPVFGAPWAIPLEFPLYQWTVAWVVRLLGFPLDQAGRLVSVAYFYASFMPAASVLGRLGVRRAHRCVLLGLWLVSPLYLFWSRTFMMESTAVFFGMCQVAAAAAMVERPRLWIALCLVACGALSGMVKLSTWVGFMIASAIFVVRGWRHRRIRSGQMLLLQVIAVGLPLIIAAAWTRFAEHFRAANPVASTFLLSSQPVFLRWMFGTVAMRWNPDFWSVIINRTVPDALGHWGFLLCAIGALWLASGRWREAAVCVACFLIEPLTFTNLHFIHSYYAYANALFLIAAVGFALVALLETTDWRRNFGMLLVLAVAAVEVRTYLRSEYYFRQRQDHPLHVAALLEQVTGADDVVVIVGEPSGWSPQIPYYARRRALIDYEIHDFNDPMMRAALDNLKSYHVGAALFCSAARARVDLVEQAQATFQLQRGAFGTDGGCDIYLPEVRTAGPSPHVPR